MKGSDMSLLLAVVGFHSSGVKGRTRIQKEMCILKHNNDIPMNFNFMSYYYGPYSSDLSSVLDSFVALGLLEQSKGYVGLGKYRYDYNLTNHGKKHLSSVKTNLQNENPELFERLEESVAKLEELSIVELISQAKNCSGIESISP